MRYVTTILLALSICLFAPACVDDTVAATTAEPTETAAPADPAPPADEVPVPRELSVVPGCAATCAARYDACLSNAQTDVDACLCFNSNVLCRRACGFPGFLRKC